MAPPSSTGSAPWKSTFLEHINKMESPEFVLSTLQVAPSGSPTPYLPRARYCIFRGFWAELPENEHNSAPKNPRVYESELPIFTTDVRMEKVGQIFGSSAGHATSDDQIKGSGGGGPVEMVFWVRELGTQWRIKGHAYIVAEDIEEGQTSGAKTVRSGIGGRMRVTDGSREADWSWTREIRAVFGNQSPMIRGSFKSPPPGKPTSTPLEDSSLSLGAKVDSLDDHVARENFRVVIVKPEEVEQLELSDPTTARRRRYRFNENSAGWEQEELWP